MDEGSWEEMINISIDNSKETRIFMPFIEPFCDEDWAERILGEIIVPFVSQYERQLEWFWFSRYYCHREVDSGSCDIEKLLKECFNSDDCHRSLRFRFRISDTNPKPIEQALEDRIKKAKCVITDIRDYPVINDLASERFAPRGLSIERKINRAKLITNLYYSISKIVLDCLVKDKDGKWKIEECPNNNNYFGTIFESLHHLFCNITSVKTAVWIFEKDDETVIAGPMNYGYYTENKWQLKEGPIFVNY